MQEFIIKVFIIAIKNSKFSSLFLKISPNAFLNPKCGFSSSNLVILGTNLNIKSVQIIPITETQEILFNPHTCAIVDETKGPKANPKEPAAIKIAIVLASSLLAN